MYGLNNNTGTTYKNSGNEITKLNKSTTNATKGAENEKIFDKAIGIMSGINDVMTGLDNFKNSNNGGGRIKAIAQTIASFMK